jgi:alkylation response protein AidB-like acyl-CoA dehydrogenase
VETQELDTSMEDEVRSRLGELLETFPPSSTEPVKFWGAQFDLGLAYVHFPVGLGGLGASPSYQELIQSELRRAGAPNNFFRNPIGVGMAAPTVLTHGSRELAERLLRPCFTTEEVWCQLFSEPGAGSDVASLATRAERDGDVWVINGQKVWTTLAHISRWGMLLARTNPDLPKHKGLTYFIVDMHAPGVEVRPLRQITGDAEFNEVFFNDVKVPDAHRLGEVGNGWSVAITTLMNERLSIGGNIAPRNSGSIGEALKIIKNSQNVTAEHKAEFMKLWCAAEAGRLLNIRAGQTRRAGNPGPEGSVAKLLYAELNKKIYSFAMDLLGQDGLLYSSYEMHRPDFAEVQRESVRSSYDLPKAFLRSRANSIEGGTSEIMRNILGERVLGLPGEPRVDKDRSWAETPRN